MGHCINLLSFGEFNTLKVSNLLFKQEAFPSNSKRSMLFLVKYTRKDSKLVFQKESILNVTVQYYVPIINTLGTRFSKVPIIDGPGKLSPITLTIEVLIVLHLT